MRDDARPLISVVIPTYKRPQLLKHLLGSLLPQVIALPPSLVEVVVVDNGLDDETPIVMGALRAGIEASSGAHGAAGALVYVRREQSVPIEQSLMAPRQYGNGEYLWSIGDDDAVYDDALARVVGYIEAHVRERGHKPELFLLNLTSWTPDFGRCIGGMHGHIPAHQEQTSFASLLDAVADLGWGVWFAYIGTTVFKAEPFRRADFSPYANSPHVLAFALLEAFGHTPCVYLRSPAIKYRTSNTLPYSQSGLRVVTIQFAECFQAAVNRGWATWKQLLGFREMIATDHKLLYLKVHSLAACMLSNIWDRVKAGDLIEAREWRLFEEAYAGYGNPEMIGMLKRLEAFDPAKQHMRELILDDLGRILIRENRSSAAFPKEFFTPP